MDNYDWKRWKEYTLIPALFGNVDRIFPNMGFHLHGGKKWITSLRFDGSSSKKPDKLYITYQKPHLIGVNGKGKGKRVIDFYMEQSGKDFLSAIKELASLCGVDFPQGDSEEWKAYEQEQKNREAANDLFRAALFSDDEGAKEALEYLKGRKWSEEEIREAELGYITTEILTTLPNQGEAYRASNKKKSGEWESIGTTHRLTIPFRNGSRILGFKVRNIRHTKEDKEQGGVKYLNTKGLKKNGLFGLLPMGEDCIVVEGELDALHAKVKGVENIAATTGGKLSEEMIKEAQRRGYKRFTLLFDTDEAGREYTEESLLSLERAKAEAWVATLPDEVKDTDEYLEQHSIESFTLLIGEALTSYEWKLHQASLRFFDDMQKGERTRKREEDYLKEVEELINSPSLMERPLSRLRLKEYIKNNEEALNLKWEDIEAWVEQGYNRQAATKRRADASSAAQKISQLMGEGKVDEALALMGETAKNLKTLDKSAEYASIFSPMSLMEFETLLSTIPQGIPTGYKIGREELTLQAGLTFICGATSHGKSSFLNSILLNVAKWNKDKGEGKSVLYFSYEIDKRRLIADLINAYVGDPDLDARAATEAPNNSPLSAIYPFFEYKAKGMTEEARRKFNPIGNHYDGFINGYMELQREYFSTGEICVVEKNYLLEDLLNAIRYYLTLYKPSAIFIDYAQLIYKEGQSRQRTEEIKDIVTEIKTFANDNGLPIVMAAQFNRSVVNPLDVLTKNIGEAGDLERVADTIVGMFNLQRPIKVSKDEKEDYRELLNPLLRRRGDKEIDASSTIASIPNRMYLSLLKRRNSLSDQKEILYWEGRIKTIKPNLPEALRTSPSQEPAGQADLFSSPQEDENSLPF